MRRQSAAGPYRFGLRVLAFVLITLAVFGLVDRLAPRLPAAWQSALSNAPDDLELLQSVSAAVSIPVIALGGVGQWSHFSQAIEATGVSAVAAANIFHYSENSVYNAKKHLYEAGLNVRRPILFSRNQDKHKYDHEEAACVTAQGASIPR